MAEVIVNSTSTFEPITSQDQLNRIIGDRIKQARENAEKKYADYDDLKAKVSDYEKQIGSLSKSLDDASKQISDFEVERNELNSKISAYETSSVKMRIAREAGIPYELADRLSGDSEEAIREDARNLSQYVARTNTAPPLKDTEGTGTDNVYTQLLSGLSKGE